MDPDRFAESLRIVLRAWRDLPHEQFEEAFENALLRLHLGRQYNPNRYINTEPLYTGSNGLILSVSDVYNPNVKLVAKVHFVINTIRREKANYDNLQELSGFARFHDAFMMPLPEENLLRSRFCYIMITEHVGESLQKIVQRSLPINQRNVVTLAYKLFLIIESMHAARLVHRDIQLKNVMLQRMPNEQLRMSLIGLDEALPLDPSPSNNSDVEGPYSSQFVDDGNPYVKFDDFTSGVYLFLELCGIDIFEFDPVNSIIFDVMRIYDPKKRFHHHPEYYLNNENDWIGELNKEIEKQRVNGYSHDHLFQIFQQAIPNFVPTVSPFLEIEYILIGNDTIFLDDPLVSSDAELENDPGSELDMRESDSLETGTYASSGIGLDAVGTTGEALDRTTIGIGAITLRASSGSNHNKSSQHKNKLHDSLELVLHKRSELEHHWKQLRMMEDFELRNVVSDKCIRWSSRGCRNGCRNGTRKGNQSRTSQSDHGGGVRGGVHGGACGDVLGLQSRRRRD